MGTGSRVMSTPAKSLPMLTISRSASSVRLRGTLVMSSATVPSGKPRPSLISVCSERETTPREASPSSLGARGAVAGGVPGLVGRVALHEALALGVVEVRALAAGPLRDEDPVARQRGRVVLEHLHVHQRGADAIGLRDAVARADERVRRRLEALPGAARGEDHR